MSVDSSIYGELTQPYRYIDKQDATLLARFPLARSVEAMTGFSTISGMQTVADERFALLTGLRRRFLLVLEGCDYITPSDFSGSAPAATLKADRYGLSGGRRVVIVKFETDYGRNQTRLLVWG